MFYNSSYSLDSTPTEEETSSIHNVVMMKKECNRYIKLLNQKFPDVTKVDFVTTSNRHDFGTYYTVDITYNDEDLQSTAEMLFIERNIPRTWEDITECSINSDEFKEVLESLNDEGLSNIEFSKETEVSFDNVLETFVDFDGDIDELEDMFYEIYG